MSPCFVRALVALSLVACSQERETPIGIAGPNMRCMRDLDNQKLYMDTFLVTHYVPASGATTCMCPTGACRVLETICTTSAEIEASTTGLESTLSGTRLEEFEPGRPSCIRVIGLSLNETATDPATCEDVVAAGLKSTTAHAGRICAATSKPSSDSLGIVIDAVGCVSQAEGYRSCIAPL